MTAVHPDTSQQAVVEAALVLLKRMGLTPADLTPVPQHRKPVPTFAGYIPVVSALVSDGGTSKGGTMRVDACVDGRGAGGGGPAARARPGAS